jgi:hypothetical protein
VGDARRVGGKARVIRPFGISNELAQRRELTVIAHRQRELGI